MKTFLAILLSAAVLSVAAVAQAPAISQSSEYPWRLQVDFAYSGGSITAAPVTQFYRSDVTQGTVIIAQPASNPESLTVDLVANGAKTVTVNGTTYTYSQAVQILTAIFAQERAAQLAALAAPSS
jgi:opacity protein-like surface antigen